MNESVLQSYSCADGSGLSSNSLTIEYWDSSNEEDKIPALVTAAITLCFMLVGLPSNLVIIVAILWKHLYRQPTYILLLNLAIVDFLLCLLVMPFSIISGFVGEYIFGSNDKERCIFCQMSLIFSAFELITISILALMSLDRLVYIKYPLNYHRIVTTCRSHIATSIIWVFSLLFSTLPTFGFGDVFYNPTVSYCLLRYTGRTDLLPNIYYPVLLVAVGLPQFFIIFFCTIWVGCIVRRHIKSIYNTNITANLEEVEGSTDQAKETAKTKLQKHLQFVKVLFSVVTANVVTWVPIIVHAIVGHLWESVPMAYVVVLFLSLISVGVVHLIIQASLIPELRQHILQLLHCNEFKLKLTSRIFQGSDI